MTACLRTLLRHRRHRLRPIARGYGITVQESGKVAAVLAWFPAWCVDGLVARGLVVDGQLSDARLEMVERFES